MKEENTDKVEKELHQITDQLSKVMKLLNNRIIDTEKIRFLSLKTQYALWLTLANLIVILFIGILTIVMNLYSFDWILIVYLMLFFSAPIIFIIYKIYNIYKEFRDVDIQSCKDLIEFKKIANEYTSELKKRLIELVNSIDN